MMALSESMAPPDPVSSLVDDIECKRPRLMWGSHGRDVLHAQRQLKKFGGKPAEYLGKIDGEYGDRMRNAVVAYQQIVFPAEPRLPRGVISLETWDKLGCGANSTPKGAPPKRWLDTLDSLK